MNFDIFIRLVTAFVVWFVFCFRNEYKLTLHSVCSNKFKCRILHHGSLTTVYCHSNIEILNETIRYAHH
jgi:hypothetical protein